MVCSMFSLYSTVSCCMQTAFIHSFWIRADLIWRKRSARFMISCHGAHSTMDVKSFPPSLHLCLCERVRLMRSWFCRAAKYSESIWNDYSSQLNDFAILLSPAPLAYYLLNVSSSHARIILRWLFLVAFCVARLYVCMRERRFIWHEIELNWQIKMLFQTRRFLTLFGCCFPIYQTATFHIIEFVGAYGPQSTIQHNTHTRRLALDCTVAYATEYA